jgi:hypothetical protein
MFGKKVLFVTFLLLCIALHSCYEAILKPPADSIQIQPGLALPLISGDLTLDNSLVLIGVPEINLDEIVPEWAQYTDIYLIDTTAFALSEIQNEAEFIRYVEFSISVWSDFPSSADFQVYFIDSEKILVDSLFHPMLQIVKSTTNMADGTVQKRGFSTSKVVCSQERIENLKATTHVVLYCRISNLDILVQQFEYYPLYKLTLKLSTRVGLDITID